MSKHVAGDDVVLRHQFVVGDVTRVYFHLNISISLDGRLMKRRILNVEIPVHYCAHLGVSLMIQNLQFGQCLRAYDEIKQELTGRQQLPPHSSRLLATARLTHTPFGVTGGHTDQQQVDDVNLKIHRGLKLNFAKSLWTGYHRCDCHRPR